MGQSGTLEVPVFTLTERVQEQKRFFCENCKREVFLAQKYCDGCGGKIEWPEKYEALLQKATASKETAAKSLAFAPNAGRERKRRWFRFRR
jgi:hypothetical protein